MHLHQPNIDYDCIIRNDVSKDRGSVVVITKEGPYQKYVPLVKALESFGIMALV